METRRWLAVGAAIALLAVALPAQSRSYTVSMRGNGSPNFYYFTPVRLIVLVGDEVTWRNATDIGHTVTAYQRSGARAFDSSPNTTQGCRDPLDPLDPPDDCIKPAETFSFTFDQPGTYDYFCKPHGSTAGETVKPNQSGAQNQPCLMCGRIEVRTKKTQQPVGGSTTPGPRAGDGTSTTKPQTTRSASPTANASPAVTPATDGSNVAAPGTDPGSGGGGGGKTALALLAILALSGAGYATWRKFLNVR